MKIGDKVQLSEKGKEWYFNDHTNPHDLEGELVRPLTLFGDFIYRVEWSNGKANRYREGELELIAEKPKFYEEVIVKSVALNRSIIHTELPSGNKFSTCGGSRSVTVMSLIKDIRNDDIPAIIDHLQQWYNAVQLEKGNKQ